MKKISILSTFGILFTITCAVLTYYDWKLFAAITGILGYAFCLFGMKSESARWQIVVFVLSAIVFGYSMCPKGGYVCMLMLMLVISLVSAVRLFFFSKLVHTKLPWLESCFILIAIGYYILGNIYDGSGWISWTFPVPSLGFAAFATIGGRIDYKSFTTNIPSAYGADIGKPAPLFSLPDQDGNIINLSDFKDKRHVLLIFVRGDWCPTCHIMLRTYEKNKAKFAEKNIMIIAIGPDPIGVNKEMVLKLGLDYKLLSDDKQYAVKAYGMQLHENSPMTKYADGVPLPAAFLIDMKGNVVYTSNPKIAGEILNPETIFPVIDKLSYAA